jgi:hypothetical protein
VFDFALKNECEALVIKLKALAEEAKNSDDVWAVHDYLTEQRKTIDVKYDYRYSQLIVVFGRLLREKWIEDKDIEGLSAEKIQAIRHIASL